MDETGQEQGWVEQSRHGDPAAFENLVRRYQRMIHSLTYRMTGSQAAAEDAAQETFIRAFRQLATYRGESRFSTWLCRIAVNACLNWRTREYRRGEIHRRWSAEVLSSYQSGTSESTLNDASLRVQDALNRLPAKQRAAVVLTVYEEMNHAEAAHVLNCTEATISWRVFAARAKLKRWLKPGAQKHE
jgi:RNA polymerase sigma-70 factor (ECF subfamily)